MAAHRRRANRSGMSPVQCRTATDTAHARQASGEAETAVRDGGRAGREVACAGRAEDVRGARGAQCCWAHAPATRWRVGGARSGGGAAGGAGQGGPRPSPAPPAAFPFATLHTWSSRAPLGRPSHPSGRHKSPASTATTVNTRPPLLPLEATRRSSYFCGRPCGSPARSGPPVVASTPFPPAPCRRKPTTARRARPGARASAGPPGGPIVRGLGPPGLGMGPAGWSHVATVCPPAP